MNYIREQVKSRKVDVDVSSKALFEDDKYLRPVLEDDALLFSLDELVDSQTDGEVAQVTRDSDASQKVKELELQLQSIQSQFSDYRLQVEETLEKRWNDAEGSSKAKASSSGDGADAAKDDGIDFEGDYFESYSYNGENGQHYSSRNLLIW